MTPFWLQNVYWSDGGDLVTIASDNSFYILKYNVSIRFLLLRFVVGGLYHLIHAPSLYLIHVRCFENGVVDRRSVSPRHASKGLLQYYGLQLVQSLHMCSHSLPYFMFSTCTI
jgi:hypothetical protein